MGNIKNAALDIAGKISSIVAAPPDDLPASSALTCSIIIPVHNSALTLRDCLNAARAATQPTDEIIVVADGDGDGSWQIAEDLGIRLIKLSNAAGPSQARNAGAAAAR